MRDPFPEPGVAGMKTIGYGDFHDSATLCVMGFIAVSTVGIAEHTGRSANVTVPVTNCD